MGSIVLKPLGSVDQSAIELDLAALPRTVSVSEGSTWQVDVRSTEFWARRQSIFVPVDGTDTQIELWPAGTLTGTAQMPLAEAVPEFLTIRFRPSPEQALALGEEESRCPVVRHSETEGRFECQVPAGTLDIRLRARGFVTQYRWGIQIPKGGAGAAGQLQFKRGAAVVGWIDSLGPQALSLCKVRLEPQQSGLSSSEQQRHRQDLLTLEANVNDRGFFNFDAVAPGAYRLTAQHPAFAPFRVAPVTVLADHEVELDSIQLQPPSRLHVQVSPPLDPYHKSWVLTLRKPSAIPGFTDTVHAGVMADELGSWQASNLEPTEHSLRIEDSRGSAWDQRTVQVHGTETFVDVELPFHRVEARLSLAGDPLAFATIWFGGRFGEQSLQRRTNEDGAAYFFLPRREEPWLVQMEARAQQVTTTWPAIEVPKAPEPGDPWVILPLEVPDTRIEGEVVSETGEPARQASVYLQQQGSVATQIRTGPDGKFLMRGVLPGNWRIHALGSAGSSSEPLDLEVHEARPTPPITLVLRPVQTLDGQILSPAGLPIPGALVIAMLDPAVATRVQHTTTDADGLFSLSLPKAAQSARLAILPPGFALTSLPLTLQGEPAEPVVLTVGELHGTLKLDFQEAAELAVTRLRILHDGHELIYSLYLPTWAQLQGAANTNSGLTVPGMPPGEYSVCLGPTPAARCASGYLPPFGELTLALPGDS